MFIFKTTEVG